MSREPGFSPGAGAPTSDEGEERLSVPSSIGCIILTGFLFSGLLCALLPRFLPLIIFGGASFLLLSEMFSDKRPLIRDDAGTPNDGRECECEPNCEARRQAAGPYSICAPKFVPRASAAL